MAIIAFWSNEEKETAQRLVNIAEITKYYDYETQMEKSQDVDSRIANFPNDKKTNT